GAEQGSDPITFSVARAVNTAVSTVINLTWNGTATFGTDYTVTASGGTLAADGSTLTLAAGSAGATLTVTPVDDLIFEGPETVVLTLAAGSNYTVGSPASASATIADNESPPAISIADATVTEGDKNATLAIPVTLSVASSTTVTVTATTNPGTALAPGDFVQTTTTLTFAPGVTQVLFNVTIVGDKVAEPTETFTVTLSNQSPNATIARATGTVTILDNDTKLVAGAAADAMLGATLTQADVARALPDAIGSWAAAGVDTRSLAAVKATVTDLPVLHLRAAARPPGRPRPHPPRPPCPPPP